jgi:outer membrane protein insertion porin family
MSVAWIVGLLLLTMPVGGGAEPGSEVVFEGNTVFSRWQLLAALRRYDVPLTGDFGATDADDAAYFLREFYFSQGFRLTDVEYDYSPSPPRVVFQIDEGIQSLIGRVTFDGGVAIDRDRLNEIFSAAVRRATLRPFGRLRYVDSAVAAAVVEILRAYAQEGDLAATARVEETPAAANQVDIHVVIDQGPQFWIQAVNFVPADESLNAELGGVVRDYLNEPYLRNADVLMRTRLQDYLRNHGFFEAQVTPTVAMDAASGDVEIEFVVSTGRQYLVGEISAQGNKQTRPRAVLSRFGIRSGERYDASKIDEGARRLWFSGAFSEAEVKATTHEDGTVDLHLQLAEARAKQLTFEVGYSEWDRFFGEIHYVDRNILGTLNRLAIDGFISTRGYGGTITLSDPWLFKTDAIGSVGLYAARRELPAYSSVEVGGVVGIERKYSTTTLTGYRIGYGWKRVTDTVVFGESDAEEDPDYTLGNIAFSQTWDTRNDLLSPMKGFYASHTLEAASPVLLGDVSFFSMEGQLTFYQPLRKITQERPFVPFFVINHAAGLVLPYGGTDIVPVQERFFLGGPNTVRGYQLDGLGPKDSAGTPLGGLAMLVANIELQWPIYKSFYAAVFTDAGNLATDIQDLSMSDTRFSSGAGVRLYTPLGAVRIDYGYNLNPGPGDPIGAWQFGFGFTF